MHETVKHKNSLKMETLGYGIGEKMNLEENLFLLIVYDLSLSSERE